MIDDNSSKPNFFFIPQLVPYSRSNETFMMGRGDSFFETSFLSKELHMGNDKPINLNTNHDTKFNLMLVKTNISNALRKVENLVSALEEISTLEKYNQISEMLFEIISITTNPLTTKDDCYKALSYQEILIEKMISFINRKIPLISE